MSMVQFPYLFAPVDTGTRLLTTALRRVNDNVSNIPLIQMEPDGDSTQGFSDLKAYMYSYGRSLSTSPLCSGGIRGRSGEKTWFNLARQLNQAYLINFLLQTYILPYKPRPYPKTLVAFNYLLLSIHKTDALLLCNLQRWYGVSTISSLCLQRHHHPTMPFVSNACKLCIPQKPQSLWRQRLVELWGQCSSSASAVGASLIS